MHTVVHQRNMRMHIVSALLVGLVGSGIPLGLAEKVTLIFCVLLVLFAEMLNTALEQLVDLAIQQFDEKARLTKDIAAAAVLVLAVGTVVIFAALLVHNASTLMEHLDNIRRQVLIGIPLILCAGALVQNLRRPTWMLVTLGLVSFACWGVSLSWTESTVFSALTLGMLIVCWSAAYTRKHESI